MKTRRKFSALSSPKYAAGSPGPLLITEEMSCLVQTDCNDMQ